MADQNGQLPSLPSELWQSILSRLSNSDIKSLRLTCRLFGDSSLRIERVFLSANPLNIEVFRSIADHKTIRHRVTEIVWDDARFIDVPQRTVSDYGMSEDETEECPVWFVKECRENLEYLEERKGDDVDRPDHIARAEQIVVRPPLKMCWEYYQHLLHQQKHVLAAESDQDIFLYGLKRFPALKRITITPVAHGWLFAPLYQTPMIRAFPKGFNYPIPRGWSTAGNHQAPPLAKPWQDLDELDKDKYRGFRIVTRVLATEEHNVSELLMDANQLSIGLDCTMFDRSCDENENLAAVLKHAVFCRLDLAFIVRGQDWEKDWRSFRNGKLYQALGEAKDMEHIKMYATSVSDSTLDRAEDSRVGSLRHSIPLQSIFPIAKWSKLRYFGLSRFVVSQPDIISLLSALPETLHSVELSFLEFIDNGGNWRDLLTEMRIRIHENCLWPDRDTASKPKITIGVKHICFRAGSGIWLEQEVCDFLYEEGEHPFGSVNYPKWGVGTVRDTFEPNYERPYVRRGVLRRLGYLKPIQ
ncbi:uncharacterized protein N7529_012160 [Penicillium soppii]|uniref:uncharacterized protein n=1 Tax=Penicillium soppii TaxID=69789 RepID=UPI002548620C|nr:uncharacterized protein N7529_012160 [Penicillium soppii]KAJ5852775.1 hypothetical protein N7529_012160 [Penicillium soppii]